MSAIDGHMRYRMREDGALVEVPPHGGVCRKNHPLKPGNVSISWDGECRTYTCWACYEAGEPESVHTLRYTTGYRAEDEAGPPRPGLVG